MTLAPKTLAETARGEFLDWLAHERRAAKLTVEAYGHDIAALLGFLTVHLGGEPDLAELAGLRLADFRAWLAAKAGEGAGAATRARHVSAARSFFRFLARRHGVTNPHLRLLRAGNFPLAFEKTSLFDPRDLLFQKRRHIFVHNTS